MTWRGIILVAAAVGLAAAPMAAAASEVVYASQDTITAPECYLCDRFDDEVQTVQDAVNDSGLTAASSSDDDELGHVRLDGALSNGGDAFVLRLNDATLPTAKISLVYYDRHGFPLSSHTTSGTTSGHIPQGAKEAVVYLDLGLHVEFQYFELAFND